MFDSPNFQDAVKTYLSQLVQDLPNNRGRALVDSSCMKAEYRKILAMLRIYRRITGDTSLQEYEGDIQTLGQMLWDRDPLTDLGLFIGKREMLNFDLT
jgi:hypothetical protein